MQNESKKIVVARLTIIRANKIKTIVEIHADASFHSFYRFFRQHGNRRSTKELIRTASRNEGVSLIGFHYQQPVGLESIAKRLEMYSSQSNPVTSTRIRIIKKRVYRKLLSARPDELGLTKTHVNLPMQRFSQLKAIPVQIPEAVNA